VDVYVNEEEVLPPICDAILRLYQITSEFDFVQMGDLLGIDSLEVNNIYLSLIEKGLIDYVSHILTDEGRAYINRRKLVNRNNLLLVPISSITNVSDSLSIIFISLILYSTVFRITTNMFNYFIKRIFSRNTIRRSGVSMFRSQEQNSSYLLLGIVLLLRMVFLLKILFIK